MYASASRVHVHDQKQNNDTPNKKKNRYKNSTTLTCTKLLEKQKVHQQ